MNERHVGLVIADDGRVVAVKRTEKEEQPAQKEGSSKQDQPWEE